VKITRGLPQAKVNAMLTPIYCPTCAVILQTPENLLGKSILCPKCKKRIKLLASGEKPAARVKANTLEAEPAESSAGLDDLASIDEMANSFGEAEQVDGEAEEEALEKVVEERTAEEMAADDDLLDSIIEAALEEAEVDSEPNAKQSQAKM